MNREVSFRRRSITACPMDILYQRAIESSAATNKGAVSCTITRFLCKSQDSFDDLDTVSCEAQSVDHISQST